ncbi:MAG TPA: DUF1566 domain-containing protein [Bryobacteraceae bacterium]|nr:DUF1566 domain-containing protein [Bryobacteraceae bacterium]
MKHLILLFLPLTLWAQDSATLTITTDAPARLEIDGAPAGPVQPGTPLQLKTSPGEHLILATPESGGPSWRKAVAVSSALPNTLALPLLTHLRRVEIQKIGFWKDERTALIWAAVDSGSGVTVSQAHAYCRQLAAGGFHDWRLPRIDELQTLFAGSTATSDERGFRLIAPLKLSGWSWSADEGREPAENWTLDLGDGARASVAAGDAGLNRALCVRR